MNPDLPDWLNLDDDPQVIDGEVIDLASERQQRRRPGPDPDDDPADEDELDDGDDAETVADDRPHLGGPVDPPDEIPVSVWTSRPMPTKPIVPDWARSRSDLYLTARWALKYAGYLAGYHAVRSPKYLGKAAFWAPIGAGKTIGRLLKWASAEEGNFHLRQHAANTNQGEIWMKLDDRRRRSAVWRWTITIPTLIIGAGALAFVTVGPVPGWWAWTMAAIATPILAYLGKPADARITDRVMPGATYRKLTAELVRNALTRLGIAGINQAVAKEGLGAISFPTEIHRDGPGHMANIDLPHGVEAEDVIARRGKLASALRLPLDQVWPEVSRTHTGRLNLWVGFEPASAMRQPAWPLASGKRVDVFQPFPFATDPRLRAKDAALMYRNWLFGGQPGSGKTFTLRLLILAALLDPTAEVRGYELKGVGDFLEVSPLLAEYGNGFDDDTIAKAAAFIDWLFDECLRRAKKIAFYKAQGKAPEGKTTRELADLKGSGLHPLIAFIDECQNLFVHKTFGKEAGEKAEQIIKLGRALGVVLVLGTQISDKDSLPTGISRQINTRFCLSVADQTANDMILGTSMYKNGHRATVFEPEIDSGWGIAVGLGKPAPYRGYLLTAAEITDIVAKATALRTKAGVLITPPEQRDAAPAYDLLADLQAVWPAGAKAAWNDTLCASLADLRPEIYGGWEAAQLTAALKPHPAITVSDIGIRIDGKAHTRRGFRAEDLIRGITERNRRRGNG